MNAMRQKAALESVADVLAEWRDEAGTLTDEDEALGAGGDGCDLAALDPSLTVIAV
jgi:hypothetical protein